MKLVGTRAPRRAPTYRAPSWGSGWVLVANYRGSASYILGAHALKFGYQGSHLGDDRTNYLNDQFVSYRFNNGVPNQVTQVINHYTILQRVRTTAFYAQDSWTLKRVTQGALRYDHAWSYNQAFSPATTTWLRPNAVLQPRFVKLSAQINF